MLMKARPRIDQGQREVNGATRSEIVFHPAYSARPCPVLVPDHHFTPPNCVPRQRLHSEACVSFNTAAEPETPNVAQSPLMNDECRRDAIR
jgi:hypothetical protein